VETITIELETRTEKGGASASRLRRSGLIPAIVYSGGKEGHLATVADREYRGNIAGVGSQRIFRFKSGAKDLDGKLGLIKEIQIEPLSGAPRHIDFFAVDEKTRIKVEVPIELTGESPSVKGGEGVLNQSAHSVEVQCLPLEIPNALYVDVGQLTIGHSIHAGDIPLPQGAVLVSEPELAIVSVVHKREEVAAPVAAPAEGADAAATAAAPAAAGKGEAAPAADTKKK
jgi:large subunit ribosomal protein L25